MAESTDQNTETEAARGSGKLSDITRHTCTDAAGFVPPWPYRAPDDPSTAHD